jgi:predicted nucleic acid-binding protein
VNVFVDTSAFYAVMDADDQYHGTAKTVWADLLHGTHRLHTTSYVLIETVALLQNRLGMECVQVFSADVQPLLEVYWVDEGTHRSAHHALLVAGRSDLSLVDCVSFEALRRLQLKEAFCFDVHFAEQGIHVLPEQRKGGIA